MDTIDDVHDDGLFGPDSVTWRVHLEPVLWIAGMRALLLQSLHPRVMRGTFQNSALFDPKKAWPRFQRTVEFVGTRTFGSTAEIEVAGGRVRRMHSMLRGYDPDTGNDFRLDLPDNLLWVHACEIDSYVDVARRARVIDDAGADAYLAESVRAAQVVGLDPAIVPSSRRAMAAYFDRVRPGLRLCDEARIGVGGLLTPQPSAPASAAIACRRSPGSRSARCRAGPDGSTACPGCPPPTRPPPRRCASSAARRRCCPTRRCPRGSPGPATWSAAPERAGSRGGGLRQPGAVEAGRHAAGQGHGGHLPGDVGRVEDEQARRGAVGAGGDRQQPALVLGPVGPG